MTPFFNIGEDYHHDDYDADGGDCVDVNPQPNQTIKKPFTEAVSVGGEMKCLRVFVA